MVYFDVVAGYYGQLHWNGNSTVQHSIHSDITYWSSSSTVAASNPVRFSPANWSSPTFGTSRSRYRINLTKSRIKTCGLIRMNLFKASLNCGVFWNGKPSYWHKYEKPSPSSSLNSVCIVSLACSRTRILRLVDMFWTIEKSNAEFCNKLIMDPYC